MRAAIIGASSEALHTINIGKKLGLEIVCLDGNPSAYGLALGDIKRVVDISDKEAVLKELSTLNIDFNLTAPIGRYLTTIGYVNDKLRLPGVSEAAAILCTDKYSFHTALARKNLRDCHCYLVNTDNSCVASNYELSYPAILKPRFGSGSRAVCYLEKKNDLADALNELPNEDFVLEECIPGEEYGFDGAIINGKFELILLRKKDNTPLPARQAVAYYSVSPKDVFYQKCLDYVNQIIQTLKLSECLIHGDIVRRKNDTPFIIELSARPSGHNLHNLFTPLCTGIDMAKEYICHRMNIPYNFTLVTTKSMMIHYFDYEGKISNIPNTSMIENLVAEYSAGLIEWKCNLMAGDILSPATNGHSLMGRGYYIIDFSACNIEHPYFCAKDINNRIKSLFSITAD